MIKKGYTLHGDLIKQVVDGTEVLVQAVAKYENKNKTKNKKIKKVSILSSSSTNTVETQINDLLSRGYDIYTIFKKDNFLFTIMVKYE